MKNWKRLLLLFLILTLLTCGCTLFNRRLESAMKTFAQSSGSAMLSLALQQALYGEISERAEEYVTVEQDASGRITAVRVHSDALSLLASELTVVLLETLRDYDGTGSALLSGRGPQIPVRPVSAGNVASELRSTLESAGINQTLHRVALHFTMAVNYLAPLESYMDTLSFDVYIAETLVVGEVPILFHP